MAASAKQDRIRRLIQQADGLPQDELQGWKERARLAVAAVYGEGSGQLKRFDKIRWSLSMWSDSTPRSAFAEAEQRGLRRSVELLQAVLEDLEEREITPDLPGLDPADFHPWVAEAAARLWQDGHRRQAVQAAASAVENWLRAKTDVHQGSMPRSQPRPSRPRTQARCAPLEVFGLRSDRIGWVEKRSRRGGRIWSGLLSENSQSLRPPRWAAGGTAGSRAPYFTEPSCSMDRQRRGRDSS